MPEGERIQAGLGWAAWSGLLAVVWLGGCATYTDHLKEAHSLHRDGQGGQAVASVDLLLTDLQNEGADTVASNIPLLQVEKASLLMSYGDFAEACDLLVSSDTSLEILDLRNTTGDTIARFLFSDTTGPYAMRPYEKGLLNTLNMLCFLAEGELNSARVEARRYSIVDKFYDSDDSGAFGAGNPLGDWLASVVFSLSERPDVAARYRTQLERRLPSWSGAPWLPQDGETRLPIVVGLGTAPLKKPVRLPIGMAMAIAGQHSKPSPESDALIAQGLVTWVNFTELVTVEPQTQTIVVRSGNDAVKLHPILNVSELVAEQFERDKPMMIGAAISRTITRAALGQGASSAAGRDGWGTLLSLAIQGTMVAMDKPDTRSWTFLPRQFWVGWAEDREQPIRIKRNLRTGGIAESIKQPVRGQTALPILYP